ncbi:glyoxylate/hydroxypyruvate reductase A [Roseibium denhamense]|uniref:Glyoxylate/hydroxypyruvate reductase A n=1 Tax=Roseibium denhamense TaxID=76305 RepID=A0ABY1NJ56_9HYPH|nr:glyoxylate/hydroxypyruvate reductase A [Roseibium denhamense]MTI06698.1 glyoxylate/hydroxypyruvate reductase A [Roseibium denhamense]SMP10414.1 glyoxylate/hydroxypyruvate reductase A [Roseibium denhamense]
MKPIVPFLSSAASEERGMWSQTLPAALNDIADVLAFEDMTPAQRAAARVAIVANPDPAEVRALPNLKWVQSLWAGVERLTAELPEDGPEIVRLVDPQMAQTMSEAVLAWTLYLHRDMPRYRAQQEKKIWQPQTLKLPSERTIGIIGLGELGRASATRLRQNGFQVAGWSRSKKHLSGITCYNGADGLQSLVASSDIVVLLAPLTSETEGLLNSELLACFKNNACLINFARGPIIDTPAMLASLENGPLAHAVLDVFATEPLPQDSPLWTHPQVAVLPHISAPTIPETAVQIVRDNIAAYFETGIHPKSVDRSRGY